MFHRRFPSLPPAVAVSGRKIGDGFAARVVVFSPALATVRPCVRPTARPRGQDEHRIQLHRNREEVAEALGGGEDLRRDRLLPEAQVLRAGHVPVSLRRRPPRRPPRGLHRHGHRLPLQASSTRSRRARSPRSRPTGTSRRSRARSSRSASPTTGTARSAPATRSTTSGRSGSSRSSTSRASPTSPRCP